MSNAAIFFASDAFDAKARLMGRQSAGESFLRGFIRHADVDRFYFWNWGGEPLDRMQALVQRIEPTAKPSVWLTRKEYPRIAEAGCLFVSAPANATEAWNRRLSGPSRYSICGLTHTTASPAVMDGLIDMLLAPVEPWDALICTSRAVKESVQVQMEGAFQFLRERFGAVTPPKIRLETIPLGINIDDFKRSDDHRRHWRGRLGIGPDDLAVLYTGRFSPHAKMNPVPMAMALERAARRTDRKLHWIQVGWASNPHLHRSFTENAARYAPSIATHVLDGRTDEVRFPIWSAADIFLSLSDNIQETFGLTPVEAMAAGLPCVVSDWNGYRDTVRHQVDGFRVATFSPRPGMGGDLALSHGNGWDTYDHYVGMVSQFAAVDIDEAAEALLALIENPELRRTMGQAAQQRARAVFDWRVVIPQYQALWKDLGDIRRAAPEKPAGGLSPWRPDPFTLYGGYPSQQLQPSALVTLSPGADLAAALAVMEDPTVSFTRAILPSPADLEVVFGLLEARRAATVSDLLAATAPARRGLVERGVLWMAKFGLVSLSPTPDVTARFGV